MNENTTSPNGGTEDEMAAKQSPTRSDVVAEPDLVPDTALTPSTEPEDDAPSLPSTTVPPESGELPDGADSFPQTGETNELVDHPGGEPPEPKPEPDLITCILFGTTIALAVVVAVLSILLVRGRKKKARHAKGGMLPVTVGKLHAQGDRDSQQDCFAVSPEELAPTHGLLAVVADGMGGLAHGDKISQTAVAAMLDGFLSSAGEPADLLLSLTEQANRQVNRLLGPVNIGKSGSTLVASLIRNNKFHYISIGDSRICLFRDDQLIQLNREHIYRNELSVQALSGIGSLQGAAAHPKAAGLTSYLGMGQLKYVDIPAQGIEIRPGDRFILMSDGVYNALSEYELTSALQKDAEKAAEMIGTMIARKAYRNQDNYTAVILAF